MNTILEKKLKEKISDFAYNEGISYGPDKTKNNGKTYVKVLFDF